MHNLHLLRNLALRSTYLSHLRGCFISCELFPSKCTEIFVFDEDLNIRRVNLSASNVLSDPATLTCLSALRENNVDEVLPVECQYVFNNFYVILNTGHLVTASGVNFEDSEISVQQLDLGSVVAASWSPDFERTVVINSEAIVSIIAIAEDDFEKITSVSLQEPTEEQNKLVNVGWGRAETQFRGSEGKYSSTSTVAQQTQENLENKGIWISWKQNSTAFAISYICHEERARKVKIFSQDGVLMNVTKGINGLQAACSWCPSRNLIACVQSLPNKRVICFLEENALRHGEFELSENTEVVRLLWNIAGSILACHGTVEKREFIALWVTSNYKWFMKQKLEFEEPVSCVQWDHSSLNRLHVVLQSGIYRMFEWRFQITGSSRCHCVTNRSLISVINERRVNTTPYRLVTMPPSMPCDSREVPECVNAVIFPYCTSEESKDLNCNSMLLYSSSNRMLLLEHERATDVKLYTISLGANDTPATFSSPLELSMWLWLLPEILCFTWAKPEDLRDKPAGNYFCVARLNSEMKYVTILETFRLKSLVTAICSYHTDVIFRYMHSPSPSNLFLIANFGYKICRRIMRPLPRYDSVLENAVKQ